MADESAEPVPFRLQLFSSLRPVRHKHHKKHHKKHHHHGPKTGLDVAKAAETEGQTPASIVRRLIQVGGAGMTDHRAAAGLWHAEWIGVLWEGLVVIFNAMMPTAPSPCLPCVHVSSG